MGDLLLLLVRAACCWSVQGFVDDALTADVKFCKLQLAVRRQL